MEPMRVKICGITNLEDARAAVDAGADYLGFIFYPPSPRAIEPARAGEIRTRLDADHRVGFVGVFVDETPARIQRILAQAGLNYAQLHGAESPADLQALAGRAFKALRPTDADQARQRAADYGHLGPAAGPQLMVDAYDPDQYGGTGKRADWQAAADLARIYPRLLLAGGLNPDNVAQAVVAVAPWGVDVSSGVEESPGRKDHDAVRAFVAAARGAQP